MKRKIFSGGDLIWIFSGVLFILYVLIANSIEIPLINISIIGSSGMLLFNVVGNIIRIKLVDEALKNSNKYNKK